jgi:hypothetical protein
VELPVARGVIGRAIPAVSGFHDKSIWYSRCNFAGASIHCVLLNYPAHEKRQWDYVVTQISHTLSSRW